MVIFLSVTTVSFSFAVNRLYQQDGDNAVIRFLVNPNSMAEKVSDGSVKQAVFDLGCLEDLGKRESLTRNEGSVRLRGRFCDNEQPAFPRISGVNILNLTNGYVGTLFFRGQDSLVSDPIILQSGRNELALEWTEKGSNRVRRVLAEVIEQ